MVESPRGSLSTYLREEPSGSFRWWLLQQDYRGDRVGCLARALRQDRCLGERRAPAEIIAHLIAEHSPEPASADAMRRAVREWWRSLT